jgi:hypothetical protein
MATNVITGMSYIGFDSRWPSRKSKHLKTLIHEKSKDLQYDSTFHRAIRKYGKDAFIWKILFQSNSNISAGNIILNTYEPHFISEYDTFNNGYNMTTGGEGIVGLKRSKTFKDNHSKLAKEKGWKPINDRSPEERKNRLQKISNSIKTVWDNRKKSGTSTGNFIWITNQIINKQIKITESVPNGWKRGRTMKKDSISGKFTGKNK